MIIIILFLLLFLFLLNNLVIKKKILGSYRGQKHQNFVNKSAPLTGGIIILFPVMYFLFDSYNFFLIIYFFLFLIGLLADLSILTSPKKRFFLQFILIFIFVFYSKLEVLPTRILIIDNYFENTLFSYFFTIFCLLILINGSNFIDGLNGLLLGYIVIIFFYLYKLVLIETIFLSSKELIYLIIILLFVLFLNLRNQLFLGDNGSYSLGFFLGFILIKIYNLNDNLSPYFIILLLWYPCFENLFSIIRKNISKTDPLKPDNNHLHQHLYIYIKNKFKFKDLLSNNLSSLIINTFNFFIFFISFIDPENTKLQLSLILLCLFIYFISYQFLIKKNLLRKK